MNLKEIKNTGIKSAEIISVKGKLGLAKSSISLRESYKRVMDKAKSEDMKFEDYGDYILVNDKYTIFEGKDNLICTCPSYKWHKPLNTCKHIESLKIHNVI